MGSISRIYGSIFSYVGGETGADYGRRVSETLWALQLLPVEDRYPPLTRNMFSLAAARYDTPGLYKELAIHFGLTLKDVEDVWDVWLDKFESVLEVVAWSEARAHLELQSPPEGFDVSSFAYRWTLPHGAERSDRTSWKFEGGPRELGGEVVRFRAHATTLQERLGSHPDDIPTLLSLIRALSRLRDYRGALECRERLQSIDPAAAKSIPFEDLVPWREWRLARF